MNIETRQLPPLALRAAVAPSTFDAAARTVEVVWTTGATVLRQDYWDGPWYESLSLAPGAVRLDRLNNGAPFLACHDNDDLDDVIGVVERAWITGNEGRALVRFSGREDVAPILQDVQDGILRNVSVGYQVHTYVIERSTDSKGPDTYTATDWEPFEISLVPIPFDAGANTRAANGQRHRRNFQPAPVQIRHPDPDPAPAAAQPETPAAAPAPAADPQPAETPTVITQEIRTVETITNGADHVQRILQLGEQYRAHVPNMDVHVTAALRAGETPEKFTERVMGAITTAHSDVRNNYIGMERGEVQEYSLARAVAAVISGDWSNAGLERSASEAIAKRSGATPSGFFVPLDVFQKRDFLAGDATGAGAIIPTELRPDMYTDVLRKQLALAKLGAVFLPGLTSNVAIPRKTAPGTFTWVTEVAGATETAPTMGQITLGPKRITSFVEYSKQSIIQSAMAVEPLLRKDLLDGLAIEIDNAGLNGTGTGGQARGLRNTSGVGAVVGGTDGANLAWTHLVGLETACANANATATDRAGYIINTKGVGTCKTTQKANYLPFIWDNGDRPLNGTQAAITNLMPSNLSKGASSGTCSSVGYGSDWSMLVVGLFGAVDVVVDPYSLATTGMVRITINQFIDVGVRQPACFAFMDDAKTP